MAAWFGSDDRPEIPPQGLENMDSAPGPTFSSSARVKPGISEDAFSTP